MFVKNFIQNKSLKNPNLKKGISLRYIEEIFLNGAENKDLKNIFGKGIINRWF